MKTDQEINEAIAKKCGWTIERDSESCILVLNDDIVGFGLPCSDLNAMHEARLSLNCLQQNSFVVELLSILGIRDDEPTEPSEMFEFANATARQRAEAFCRTVGIPID